MKKIIIETIRYLNIFMILIGCPMILIYLGVNEIISFDNVAWIYFLYFIIGWLGIANKLNKMKVDDIK